MSERSRCVFCQIVDREAPAEILYQDDRVTAFRDARPAAPVHILVVPNRHISSMNEIGEADDALAGRLMLVARRLAAQEGIEQSGYRLVVNTGQHGGQVVYHLHLHLLGGHRMRYPMG